MRLKHLSAVVLSSLLCTSYALASTASYLESIKHQPAQLHAFLLAMPKGGDLHNHVAGATYAENLIKYAAQDGLCLDTTTMAVNQDPACTQDYLLDNAIKNPELYDEIIDAWSMRHFHQGKESGHDHFFSTFGKFGFISGHHTGEILAEIAERAAKENESYLELMITADGNESGRLGKKLGWDSDFESMQKKLMANGLPEIVKNLHAALDNNEAKMRSILQCDKKNPKKRLWGNFALSVSSLARTDP